MKKLLIILILLLSINAFGQKDSIQVWTLVSNVKDGIRYSAPQKTEYLMHWSWKRKEWCMLTDSMYDAYYGRFLHDISDYTKDLMWSGGVGPALFYELKETKD